MRFACSFFYDRKNYPISLSEKTSKILKNITKHNIINKKDKGDVILCIRHQKKDIKR